MKQKTSPWLLAMLYEQWAESLRSRKSEERTISLENITDRAPDADDFRITSTRLLNRFSSEQIINAFNDLLTEHKYILLLYDFEEITLEGIAAITGLPVGIVQNRLNSGRVQLKKSLAGTESKVTCPELSL